MCSDFGESCEPDRYVVFGACCSIWCREFLTFANCEDGSFHRAVLLTGWLATRHRCGVLYPPRLYCSELYPCRFDAAYRNGDVGCLP